MKGKYLTRTVFCLALLLSSGCAGGTSGSVLNSSQSCHNLGGYGDCEGRIGRLSGTYSIEIEDEGISPGDEVVVEITLAVEGGAALVTLPGLEGGDTTVEANPGPVNLTGIVGGDFDGFEFTLQALGEYAEGITYSIRYFIQ